MKIKTKAIEKSRPYSLILFKLAERPDNIAGISETLRKSPSIVENQLEILEDEGFVKTGRNGIYLVNWNKILFLLVEKNMEPLIKKIEPMMNFLPGSKGEKRLLRDYEEVKKNFPKLKKEVKRSKAIAEMIKWAFEYRLKTGDKSTVMDVLNEFGVFMRSKHDISKTIFNSHGEGTLHAKLVRFFGLPDRMLKIGFGGTKKSGAAYPRRRT